MFNDVCLCPKGEALLLIANSGRLTTEKEGVTKVRPTAFCCQRYQRPLLTSKYLPPLYG
jgi:hypothetical protein